MNTPPERAGLGTLHVDDQELVITRAKAEDVPAIVGLLADDMLGRGRESAGDDARYLKAFHAIDDDPNQVLAVVRTEEDQIAAVAQITFIPGLSRGGALRAQIESVRVGARHRGAGLGRAFLEWMIEYSADRGAAIVQLTTDRRRTDAVRFYERLGFVASHEGMKLALPR